MSTYYKQIQFDKFEEVEIYLEILSPKIDGGNQKA